MREVMKRQTELGELAIGSIVLDPKSRDDIPKLLVGLQYVYTHRELRDEVFAILQEVGLDHHSGHLSRRRPRPPKQPYLMPVSA